MEILRETVVHDSDDTTLRSAEAPPATASPSAVSWGAIFAGAAAAAGISLILLFTGAGLGFSSASPWAHEGASAATLGISAILWLSLTQLAAAAVGGYLAGRLRTRWVRVHTHEVYFRDTAHGFVSWAVATLAAASLFASVAGSAIGGGVKAGAAAAAVTGTADAETLAYYVDTSFRSTPGHPIPAGSGDPATTAALDRIYLHALAGPGLTAEDVRAGGELVSARTGLPREQAEQRVTSTYAALKAKLEAAAAKAKEAADQARKASAYASLWFAISLLIGAFIASWAATFGGRLRDSHN
jgi:hypothetical protein